MAQHTVSFEWRVVEDKEPWGQVEPLADRPATQSEPRQLLPALGRCAALILVSLVAASGALAPVQSAEGRLHRAIEAALGREEAVWQANDARQYSQLLDHQLARMWQRDWFAPWGIDPRRRTSLATSLVRVEPQPDVVAAHTLVFDPGTEWWRAVPYRETRFYRQTAQGWVRTVPGADFWGAPQTVETPHLRFRFYQRDGATVFAIADGLERAYLAVYALLELTPPAERLTITLAPVPDVVHEFSNDVEPITLASPALMRTPVGLSDAEQLEHLLVNHLTARAVFHSLAEVGRSSLYRRRTLLWGVRGWMRTTILGERSPWQSQAALVFRQLNHGYRPLRLTDISDRYPSEFPTDAEYMWEYIAAESVVAYTVAHYGVDRLPDLLHGVGGFSYWGGLIEDVFGIPVEEFEQGWNRYLALQYPPLAPAPEASSHGKW
jgi:hypothetical protein